MYVLNRLRKRAHLLPTIERCNADQLKSREIVQEIPAGFRLCGWCAKRE